MSSGSKKMEEEKEIYRADPAPIKHVSEIPLFSKVLDESNPQARAILALQKDDTPESRAMRYKKSGNKCYIVGKVTLFVCVCVCVFFVFFYAESQQKFVFDKKKTKERYKDAITYYTQGIEMNSKNRKLNAQLHNNRAQVHLKQQNYGKVISDSSRAIQFYPRIIKSYYRCAYACKCLHKFQDAIEWCDKGLSYDSLFLFFVSVTVVIAQIRNQFRLCLPRERKGTQKKVKITYLQKKKNSCFCFVYTPQNICTQKTKQKIKNKK